MSLDTLYPFLITTEQKYINKQLLEEAYEYNIIFSKCEQLKKYLISEYYTLYEKFCNQIYIIKREWIDIFKKLCNIDFIDYNLLNIKCKQS